jgi:hypothetical protein
MASRICDRGGAVAAVDALPALQPASIVGEIARRDRLGGLVYEYERSAA